MSLRDDAPEDAPAFDASAIPDDTAYWDALAKRVTAGATRSDSGLEWLAGSRAGIAACLLAASGVIGVVASRNPAAAPPPARESFVTFTAGDDVARAVMFRSEPPSVGALIIASAPGAAK